MVSWVVAMGGDSCGAWCGILEIAFLFWYGNPGGTTIKAIRRVGVEDVRRQSCPHDDFAWV